MQILVQAVYHGGTGGFSRSQRRSCGGKGLSSKSYRSSNRANHSSDNLPRGQAVFVAAKGYRQNHINPLIMQIIVQTIYHRGFFTYFADCDSRKATNCSQKVSALPCKKTLCYSLSQCLCGSLRQKKPVINARFNKISA
jgi:hypothetical protein